MPRSVLTRENRGLPLRVDDADTVLHAKPAIASHMILATDDGHFVFLAERGNVDDKPLNQDLFVIAAFSKMTRQYQSPPGDSAAMVL
jgi:hypothetical protein